MIRAAGVPFPVGLVTIGVELTGAPGAQEVAASQAAVRFVNEELGGVDGRPLELVVGEELADVERAAECARRFVDAGAVAVFGLGVAWAAGGLPVLEEAGVPWVGAAINPAESTSPVSYPLIGGVPAELAALAKYLGTRGTRSVAVVAPEIPQLEDSMNLFRDLLASRGIDALEVRTVPLGAPDLESAARDVADAADVVMPLLGGQEAAAFMRLARDVGIDGPLVFVGTAMDDEVFEAAGEASEGTLHCAEFFPYDDPSNPQVATFRDALRRYSQLPPTSYAQGSFGSVVTIADMGSRIGASSLSAATMLEHVRSATDQPVFMSSALNVADAPPDFPHLGNVDCLVLERRAGRLVDVGDGWINGWH